MPGKYIDAEQALASLDRSPVVLRGFQGRDWELFAAMPAKPVFKLMLLEDEGRSQDELKYRELISTMSEMVPANVFAAWLDGGLTMAEALVLLNRVIATYNGDGEDAEGEVTSPSPASSTGSQ